LHQVAVVDAAAAATHCKVQQRNDPWLALKAANTDTCQQQQQQQQQQRQ
jgi:hypothetical protein